MQICWSRHTNTQQCYNGYWVSGNCYIDCDCMIAYLRRWRSTVETQSISIQWKFNVHSILCFPFVRPFPVLGPNNINYWLFSISLWITADGNCLSRTCWCVVCIFNHNNNTLIFLQLNFQAPKPTLTLGPMRIPTGLSINLPRSWMPLALKLSELLEQVSPSSVS